MLDAADAARPGLAGRRRRGELLDGAGRLVIRHVDRLNARRLHALSAALQETLAAGRQDALWVAVTLSERPARPADLAELLRFFPSTVELPPLRHHIEDLHELVPFFLAKLSQYGAADLLARGHAAADAVQLAGQHRAALAGAAAGSCSTGAPASIQPGDLPPECWTVSRRLLSPLESMERDAIVQSLLDASGNKVKAAESLGMSRATIYRKIHEYGIVTPG